MVSYSPAGLQLACSKDVTELQNLLFHLLLSAGFVSVCHHACLALGSKPGASCRLSRHSTNGATHIPVLTTERTRSGSNILHLLSSPSISTTFSLLQLKLGPRGTFLSNTTSPVPLPEPLQPPFHPCIANYLSDLRRCTHSSLWVWFISLSECFKQGLLAILMPGSGSFLEKLW